MTPADFNLSSQATVDAPCSSQEDSANGQSVNDNTIVYPINRGTSDQFTTNQRIIKAFTSLKDSLLSRISPVATRLRPLPSRLVRAINPKHKEPMQDELKPKAPPRNLPELPEDEVNRGYDGDYEYDSEPEDPRPSKIGSTSKRNRASNYPAYHDSDTDNISIMSDLINKVDMVGNTTYETHQENNRHPHLRGDSSVALTTTENSSSEFSSEEIPTSSRIAPPKKKYFRKRKKLYTKSFSTDGSASGYETTKKNQASGSSTPENTDNSSLEKTPTKKPGFKMTNEKLLDLPHIALRMMDPPERFGMRQVRPSDFESGESDSSSEEERAAIRRAFNPYEDTLHASDQEDRLSESHIVYTETIPQASGSSTPENTDNSSLEKTPTKKPGFKMTNEKLLDLPHIALRMMDPPERFGMRQVRPSDFESGESDSSSEEERAAIRRAFNPYEDTLHASDQEDRLSESHIVYTETIPQASGSSTPENTDNSSLEKTPTKKPGFKMTNEKLLDLPHIALRMMDPPERFGMRQVRPSDFESGESDSSSEEERAAIRRAFNPYEDTLHASDQEDRLSESHIVYTETIPQASGSSTPENTDNSSLEKTPTKKPGFKMTNEKLLDLPHIALRMMDPPERFGMRQVRPSDFESGESDSSSEEERAAIRRAFNPYEDTLHASDPSSSSEVDE